MLQGGMVLQVRIHFKSDLIRNLGAHSALFPELHQVRCPAAQLSFLMRRQPLKKAQVQIIAAARHDGEFVARNLGAELEVVTNKDELLYKFQRANESQRGPVLRKALDFAPGHRDRDDVQPSVRLTADDVDQRVLQQ